MIRTAEQFQKMADATKACENLARATATGLEVKDPVTSISLMFQLGESDDYIEIDVPMSAKDRLIEVVRPVLEEIRVEVCGD